MSKVLGPPIGRVFGRTHPPGYRRPLSHTIADSRLRDHAPSWVLCDCGELVQADNAKGAESGFRTHRSEVGLRTPTLAESATNHRAYS